MKLLRVIGSMDPVSGGPCQGIRSAHAEMERLGVAEEVVCLDDPKASYLKRETITVHAIGMRRGALNYHSALVPWLTRNIDRFDVIVVHGLWQWNSIATWLAIRSLKKKASGRKIPPYFVMPHGMLDPWFQRAKSRKLKAIRNWFYWKLVQHRVIRDAEAILFTCEEELILARTTFRPYQPKREINVGYGIAEPPYKSVAMNNAFRAKCPDLSTFYNDQPYLLFLSRIHPKKGVDLLIKAYGKTKKSKNLKSVVTDPKQQQAQPTIKNSLPVLVIAGPGLETAYGRKMQKMASDLCPHNSVIFTGMLQGDAKWGAIYGCDAFVLPSHQENFGIAVVEALACDKPVLISNQINIWREIQSSRGGLIAKDTTEDIGQLLTQWMEMTVAEMKTFQPKECFRKHFEVQAAAETFKKALKAYV